MSIKNPLPGHQYGTSEPGYWYPRPDPPKRGRRKLRSSRKWLRWLCVVLIGALTVDYGIHHHEQLAARARGYVSNQAAASAAAAPPVTFPGPTAAPAPTGYPGAQAGDRRPDGSGAVTVGGLAVVASNWVTMSIDGGQRALCVTASVVNRNAVEVSYGPMDWTLQSPTGDVHAPIPVIYDLGQPGSQPAGLTSGQLIPGGSTSGRVCFSDPGTAGSYVVAYRPEAQGGGRGIWLVRL